MNFVDFPTKIIFKANWIILRFSYNQEPYTKKLLLIQPSPNLRNPTPIS